jgi:hypothetical protein
MVKKMTEFKSEARHVRVLERFVDTADLFFLRNDVYLTGRVTTDRGVEWILKETENSDPSRKNICYVITKGDDIFEKLRALFIREGRAWNPKWTSFKQIGERSISYFETERFFVSEKNDVWLDIARWELRGNDGLYAVLTASITPLFDYDTLSVIFGPEPLHSAPSKVVASLVQAHRGADTTCNKILATKSYCVDASNILQSYHTAPDTRFDAIHEFKPYPRHE